MPVFPPLTSGTVAGGSIDGSGTTNEITYWVDSDTLGSLTTATYPSLTELSYVKGVTSAIQTQLNSKQASITGSDTHVLFFDGANTPAGDAGLTYNKTTNTLTVEDIITQTLTGVSGVNLALSTPNGDSGTNISISTGSASSGDNEGGTFSQVLGNGSGSASGGNYTLITGDGGDTGDGGAVSFSGGSGGATSGAGGNVVFKGGTAATEGDGGSVIFRNGAGAGAGVDGVFAFDHLDAGIQGILDFSSLATSNKTFTFPNATGTIALSTGAFTSTRIPFADSNGLLVDDAGLTYNAATDTFTIVNSISTTTVNATTIRGTNFSDSNSVNNSRIEHNSTTKRIDFNVNNIDWVSIDSTGAITSNVATGTAPLIIASTTKVANLNADLLDDQTGSYYLDSANFTGTNWTDLTDGGGTTLHSHTLAVGATDVTASAAELNILDGATLTVTELNYVDGVTSAIQTQLDAKANSAGSLTQFIGNTAWRVFYSDSAGDIIELALGADGTFLKSNGAAAAPTFATPAGSGDVTKVGTPVNNQVGVWTGDGTLEGDAALTYDSTTDTLTSVTFAGALTGVASGNALPALSNLASVAINTTLVSDTYNTDALGTSAIAWSDLFLGDGAVIEWSSAASTSDVTLTHSANTLTFAGGTIALGTATATGGLTGNVTGNVSGTAATVTGAAQTAITSLGTLTALDVDNININGNTISSTAGTDLLITPLAGQQLILDGTIEIDAGVVTGATSITSTTFVGALTGNASGTAATVTGATQAAITTLANLVSVQGLTVTLADAGANAFFGWDDVAGAYENLTSGEAFAILGVTSSAAELNILDGATLTVTELNYVDGVTSAIQTQLDAKQALDATLTALAGLTITQGSLITGTGADAFSVLPKGTAGQVLTMNAGATAPEWAASAGGIPTAITVANEATDTTCFPLFVTAATGDLGPKSNAGLTFNSNTGLLSATLLKSLGNFEIGNDGAGVDYTLTFKGETADGVLTWMEDEDYFAYSDDILMNTTERIYWRDSGLYAYSSADGVLDIVADTTLNLGAVGDTTLGDGTLRKFSPQTTLKIDFGDSTHVFNKGYIDALESVSTINGYVAPLSGTYTPTLTNVTNVAASTAYECQYIRVGSVVTVSGKVAIDVTTGVATATELGLSLPIASNLATEEDLGGTAVTNTPTVTACARIRADTTNDRAAVVFNAVSTTNDSYSFTFTYSII